MFIKVSYTILDSNSICRKCFAPVLTGGGGDIGRHIYFFFIFVKTIYYELFSYKDSYVVEYRRNVKETNIIILK